MGKTLVSLYTERIYSDMEKLLRSAVVCWGIRLLMAVSFSAFALRQILVEHYNMRNILFTGTVAFVCAIYFIQKTEQENIDYIKKHLFVLVVIFLMVFIIVREGHRIKGASCYEMIPVFWPFRFFRLRWYLFSMLFLTYFGVWLYRKMVSVITAVFAECTALDIKLYFCFTVIISLIVFAFYLTTPKWYLQYDMVYSIDSGWCFQNIFPRVDYYDIRHPVLGEVAFPIWVVINGVLVFLAPENLIEKLSAVCIQLLNVQFLLMTGIIIKNMAKSHFVFLLYVSSFPFLLFSVSLEKYQLCTFLVVLYIYTMYKNRKESLGILIMAIGVMPTSGFIAILELFTRDSFKNKIMKIIKIAFLGAVAVICFGRAHLLFPANVLAEVTNTKTSFASGTLTLTERLVSVVKMVQSSFVALSSTASDRYLWTSVTSDITVFSMALILLMAVGAFSHREEKFVKICSLWSLFSVVLFVGLNWAPHESPLFAVYFSWAFIPLVKCGIDTVTDRFSIHERIVYVVMLSVMLLVNVAALTEIHKYLLSVS